MGQKPMLKGTTEASVNTKGTEDVEAQLRWQFTGCSYHHRRKQFAFLASYYRPTDISHPIIELISAPFRVFARKQTGKAKTVRTQTQTSTNAQKRSAYEAGLSLSDMAPTCKKARVAVHDRKEEEEEEKENTSSQVSSEKNDYMSAFKHKLAELVSLRRKLTPEEQCSVADLVRSELLSCQQQDTSPTLTTQNKPTDSQTAVLPLPYSFTPEYSNLVNPWPAFSYDNNLLCNTNNQELKDKQDSALQFDDLLDISSIF